MESDTFDPEDQCHCTESRTVHIAQLAIAGNLAEVRALYAYAPIDSAQTALMRCRRDCCPFHDDVDQAIDALGDLLRAEERDDAAIDEVQHAAL